MDRSLRITAVSALVCFLLAGVSRFIDVDSWHQMALARATLERGYMPLADTFAYTPTVYPVMHHEWGTGMIMYALATHGGLPAVLLAQIGLVLLLAVMCWHVARRHADVAVTTTLAPIAISLAWGGCTAIRGLLFTMLFTAALLAALDGDRNGRHGWVLWWLPLYVLWVNLHAGFVVGIAICVLHTVEQGVRGRSIGHLLAVIAAMLALIIVNPYGLAYYPHLWRGLMFDRSLIAEWAPLWRAPSRLAILVYAVSVLIALYGVLKLGPVAAEGWPIVAVTAAAALRHQRHATFYAVIWFCIVPAWIERARLGEMFRAFWIRRRAALAVWATALALTLVVDVRSRIWSLSIPANPGDHPEIVYPVGAVEYLHEHAIGCNLLVPFEYGAYVSWKLAPAVKVSLDSRYEAAYPPALLPEHLRFYAAEPGWQRMLDRYPTTAILVRHNERIEPVLEREPAWERVYDDDAYAIFARTKLGLPVVTRRGQRLVGRFP